MEQMTIYDFLPDPNKILEVDVMGLLDDAYCPRCKVCLPDSSIDGPCPYCGQKLEWKHWHIMNPEYYNGKWHFDKNNEKEN